MDTESEPDAEVKTADCGCESDSDTDAAAEDASPPAAVGVEVVERDLEWC